MDPDEKEGGEKPAKDTPKTLTEDDVQKVVATRFKAFEKSIEKTIADAVGGIATRFRDELAAILPKVEALPAPAAPGEEAPKPKKDPELKKLHDQVATLTTKAEQAEKERDAERARTKDSTLRTKVAEALATAGIEGLRARHATGHLIDAEKRVRWSDDGNAILFRDADGEDVELAAGLTGWLKTDDGKFFLPPRGTKGSGDRPGTDPPTNPNAPLDRAAVAEGLRRALTGQL